MRTTRRADPTRSSLLRGAAAAALVVGALLLAGVPAALGIAVILLGVGLLSRAGARPATAPPRAGASFLVHEHSAGRLPIILMRLPDDGEGVEALRRRGWTTIEPPMNGPLAPVRRLGVEFDGHDGLVVRDLQAPLTPPVLAARATSPPPAGWGRAAQDAGCVLLLLDDGRAPVGSVAALGGYALLRGVPGGA